MAGWYQNRALFLLLSGPSIKTMDLSVLDRRGVTVMAVNHAASLFRPDLWISVDDPRHFPDAIWRDPSIIKFVPERLVDYRTARADLNKHRLLDARVRDMPGVWLFKPNARFNSRRFFNETTVSYGAGKRFKDDLGIRSFRSTMLASIKVAWTLGFARIYLIGADFKMNRGAENYPINQPTGPGAVHYNNMLYKALNDRFRAISKSFHSRGLQIFNTTPKSGCNAFEFVDLQTAIRRETKDFGDDYFERWYAASPPGKD